MQLRWLAITALPILVAVCSPPPPPPSSADVQDYLEHLRSWAPQEAEIGRAISRLLRTEFVDAAEVGRNVRDTLPRIDRQIALLRPYQPRSERLTEVHRTHLNAWNDLRDGYLAIERGMDSGDQAPLAAGRRALLAWRETVRRVADELRLLVAQTDDAPPI
jgi:hypothetical protein